MIDSILDNPRFGDWAGRAPRERRTKHFIADIGYGAGNGPSWSTCSCGRQLVADTPAMLETRWKRHKGKEPTDGHV